MGKRADYSWIGEMDLDGRHHFWFEAAMVSTFPGIFDHCGDNYEVEDVLRKAGVIHKKNQTDTESCALVINFKSRKSAEKFIERLNKWLDEKEGVSPEAQDSTLFPKPSDASRMVLSRIHYETLKWADEMDVMAAQLKEKAEVEQAPGAKQLMMSLSSNMKRWAQFSLRQAQYDARRIYDQSY